MNVPWEILKRNINARIFLIFGFVQSLWFIEAVWYFYWARFMSYTQIGLVFSFLVIVGLIAEIPTGMFADKYGRKNSVLLGTLLLSMGGGLMTSAYGALQLIVGVTLISIGRAFISGSLEAIVYDSLKTDRLENSWDRLVSTKIQLSLLAYIIAVPIGGFFYRMYFRIPNILETIAMLVSIVVASYLSEPKAELLTNKRFVGLNLHELGVGFRELWNIKIRPYLIPSFMIITIFELYDWGLSKPAMAINFGLDSRGQAIVYTGMAIVNILAVGQMPRLRRIMGDYWGLRILNMVSGIAFVVSTYIFSYWGVVTMLLLETSGNMGDPWTSSVVNEHLSSKYRATTLSTLAFLTRIPHFFVNILAGKAIDGLGINSFHLWFGVLIIVVTMATMVNRRALLTQKT